MQRIPQSSSPETDAPIYFHGELAEDGSRNDLQPTIRSMVEQLPDGTPPPAASPGHLSGHKMQTEPMTPPATDAEGNAPSWYVSAWALGRGTLFVVHNVESDWTLTAWSVDELKQRLTPSQQRAAS